MLRFDRLVLEVGASQALANDLGGFGDPLSLNDPLIFFPRGFDLGRLAL